VHLLLLSLDDTLVDRAGAFADWGRDFLDRIGAPRHDLDWLLAIDADGISSRWDVAEALRHRYDLAESAADLVEEQRAMVLARLRPDPLLGCALRIAIDAGLVPVVVTNGDSGQQLEKLRRTGLDRYVADCIVSNEVGVRKPNPRIFAIAAQRVRMSLRDAWMIGDSPEADINGAVAVGIPSVWLHRGRPWPERRYAPTYVADCAIAAISVVLDDLR